MRRCGKALAFLTYPEKLLQSPKRIPLHVNLDTSENMQILGKWVKGVFDHNLNGFRPYQDAGKKLTGQKIMGLCLTAIFAQVEGGPKCNTQNIQMIKFPIGWVDHLDVGWGITFWTTL